MTLASLKERVLALLDERAGTVAGDRFLSKINLFTDMAQREAALAVPIISAEEIDVENGVARLPDNVCTAMGLYKNGKSVPFYQMGNSILADDGQYTLEFSAYPDEIRADSPDSTPLSVCDAAAQALPFYVAALCVMGEDAAQYQTLLEHYSARLEGAKTARAKVVL